jgi:uncharacterized protein (DUF2336 family)
VASRREEQVRRAEEAYGREHQLERAAAGEETHRLLRDFACEIAAEVDATAPPGPLGPVDTAGLLRAAFDAETPEPEDPLVPKLLRAAMDEANRRQA